MTDRAPVSGNAMSFGGGSAETASSVPPPAEPRPPWYRRALAAIRSYFVEEYPDVIASLTPFAFLAMALFTRHPYKTNFIFDEQEALLANPYVRSVTDAGSKLGWFDAFTRDFWGLPPEGTIGSYRPLPDLVWRLLWWFGARDSPFFHHGVNILLHALNGALLTSFVMRLRGDRLVAWLAGAYFVGAAILTEAVSGVVGIADVLGGMGALLALHALRLSIPAMTGAVLGATLFGLYAKESGLCIVVLAPLAALLLSDALHPVKPRRWLRAVLAGSASIGAFVFYVEMRRRHFPARLSPDIAEGVSLGEPLKEAYHALLRWYAQPILPHDALNNPLVRATFSERVAGALRVYVRGLVQVFVPRNLSGDYSAPQEPVPGSLHEPETILGALFVALPVFLGLGLAIVYLVKTRGWGGLRDESITEPSMKEAPLVLETPVEPPPAGSLVPPPVEEHRGLLGEPFVAVEVQPLVALALLWIVASYLPVSNIPVVLPTVRAERFWYFPVIGTSLLLALFTGWAFRRARRRGWGNAVGGAVVVYMVLQAVAARSHANDYADDLTFWDATRKTVTRSAKAHLNYSVMLGARGNLQGRLEANAVALRLAPEWPMANVYYGDTLCRLHRIEEAWPHYLRGFALAPQDPNLLALGLQCLWDEKAFEAGSPHREEIEIRSHEVPGSWYEYLVRDLLDHGEEHHGVDPKRRPRGYNEGPKKE